MLKERKASEILQRRRLLRLVPRTHNKLGDRRFSAAGLVQQPNPISGLEVVLEYEVFLMLIIDV